MTYQINRNVSLLKTELQRSFKIFEFTVCGIRQ